MTPQQPTQPVDPFEQEVRRALTDEAAQPAPDRLVARVATIPDTSRPDAAWLSLLRGRVGVGPGLGIRLGLAATAVVAVVLVGGSLLLGSFGSDSGIGGPSAGPGGGSPSAGVSPSPSADAVAPSPSASVGPSPSVGPSSSVGPSVSAPAGGPVPTDFQPASVTFISADEGWLLGTGSCGATRCLAIVRTTDGGRTWASIPAPDTALASDGSTGVTGLRFADTLDGWAFGTGLWATHDGGSTWHRVSLPGLPKDGDVMALEASAGVVHAVYPDDRPGPRLTIASSPTDFDRWTASPTTVEIGAGPVPRPQLVLHGPAGWLIEVDRAVVAGARLVAGAWTPWQPPCLDVAGPASLAASSESDLVAACDEGLWSTPTGVHVYVSTDGGSTFDPAASKPPVFDVEGVAAPAPGVTFVGGSLSGVGSAIIGSFDDGKTWPAVHVLPGAASTGLTFPTDQVGVAIGQTIGDQGSPSAELLMTRDGGRTWSKVPITGG